MQPKVYHFDQHQIPPEAIDTHAFYVIQKLQEAGHDAYLVGGGVRDLLLKKQPKDFDISTSARPEEVRALFRNAILIGRRFRLVHVRFGKKILEVSTFRAGDSETAALIVRDNIWGSEEEDVLRRDFTINGLYYNPANQSVIDYIEGFPDLEKRILRAIGPPDVRFVQDPVRMIRLIKFCARFDFQIHSLTHEALLLCRDHIVKSSAVRILEELFRMLESGFSEPFFHLLHHYGLLKHLTAPLAHFMDLDSDHRIEKMLHVVDCEVKKQSSPPHRALLFSALCFPIFDLTIHHIMHESQTVPHFGTIAEEANSLITNLFAPFFHIPRMMRSMMVSILTTQYRLTPLIERQGHLKLPHEYTTPLALQLLKMRSALDPSLVPIHTHWSEITFAEESLPPPSRHLHRRRRRPH